MAPEKRAETKQRRSEVNAQNSELNPMAHPSGARIEKMYDSYDKKRHHSPKESTPNGSEEPDYHHRASPQQDRKS